MLCYTILYYTILYYAIIYSTIIYCKPSRVMARPRLKPRAALPKRVLKRQRKVVSGTRTIRSCASGPELFELEIGRLGLVSATHRFGIRDGSRCELCGRRERAEGAAIGEKRNDGRGELRRSPGREPRAQTATQLLRSHARASDGRASVLRRPSCCGVPLGSSRDAPRGPAGSRNASFRALVFVCGFMQHVTGCAYFASRLGEHPAPRPCLRVLWRKALFYYPRCCRSPTCRRSVVPAAAWQTLCARCLLGVRGVASGV